MKILYVLRTVIMYIYMFGYMLLYYPVLRRGEKALAAGDREALRRIVDRHIPRWCRGLLRVAGVQLIVEGRENIPAGGPAVFVGNHRSYFDIPLVLVSFDRPHGILAKEELARIPLLSRWMHLLGCVYVQRDDVRGSVQALKDAAAVVRGGDSFTIFPEGTRNSGEELSMLPFKDGAFKISTKTGCAIIPISLNNTAEIFENHMPKVRKTHVVIEYGKPIYPDQLDKDTKRHISDHVENIIRETIHKNAELV